MRFRRWRDSDRNRDLDNEEIGRGILDAESAEGFENLSHTHTPYLVNQKIIDKLSTFLSRKGRW